jgi:Family of unknown function (DUF6325)
VADFEYGPVDLYLIGFPGERPSPEVVSAIRALLDAGTVRLLDMLFVSRSVDGELTVLELEQVGEKFGFSGLVLDEVGLASTEDIDEFAEAVEPGESAALLVVELVWAKQFATALFAGGGRVLHTESIPADAVNELLAETDDE